MCLSVRENITSVDRCNVRKIKKKKSVGGKGKEKRKENEGRLRRL